MSAPIVVVGSANLDIVVPVPHHPVTGETVLGGDHSQIPGGKGANQAVAAARLGASVDFVGRVGSDDAGVELRRSLDESGVNTAALHNTTDAPSGIALITVGPDGDNCIVVSPGANHRLSVDDIAESDAVASAKVLLLQLEVPLEANLAAAKLAGGMVLLDPAPAPPDGLPDELLSLVDVVMPNETELAALAGRTIDAADIDDIVDAARSLSCPHVLVTLGSRGALVVSNDVTEVRAPVITAVDTTAAGDGFRAAIAVGLARGDSLVDSARLAVRVGAATALRFGAQPSLPTAAEVDELLP